MTSRLLWSVIAAAGLLAAHASGSSGTPRAPAPGATVPAGITVGDPVHDPESCLGGCAAVSADVEAASDAQIARWLEAVQRAEPGAPSDELENLMYHWREAAPYLETLDADAVAAPHRAYLERELARATVRVRARLVTDSGDIRVDFDRELAFGERTHFWPERVDGVQTPEFSGTIQRVGAEHLWARF